MTKSLNDDAILFIETDNIINNINFVGKEGSDVISIS